jgi:hypothetical protein
MARLQVTFRGEQPTVFEGPPEKVRELESRIHAAMSGSKDVIISHDLDTEPRSFLCSEIVDIHPVEV